MRTNNTTVIQSGQTPFERADALRSAREVLLVKSGKFAERDLDPFALLVVAEYVLTGDWPKTLRAFEQRADEEARRWSTENSADDRQKFIVKVSHLDAAETVIDKIDNALAGLAEVIPFDDGNGAGLNR